MAAKTNAGLYRQEADEQNAKLYKTLLGVIQNAKSVEELNALIQ